MLCKLLNTICFSGKKEFFLFSWNRKNRKICAFLFSAVVFLIFFNEIWIEITRKKL
jgi:hypothetical protein